MIVLKTNIDEIPEYCERCPYGIEKYSHYLVAIECPILKTSVSIYDSKEWRTRPLDCPMIKI